MYIRETKTKNKKTGNVYLKHSLVESYHTPKGSRQRTIMQLGSLSLAKKHWPTLAKELEKRLMGKSLSEQLPLISSNKSAREISFEKSIRDIVNESIKHYHFFARKNFNESLSRKQCDRN